MRPFDETPETDLDRVMRDGEAKAPPNPMPSFRVPIIAAAFAIAIWAGIALFWPAHPALPKCGQLRSGESCVSGH